MKRLFTTLAFLLTVSLPALGANVSTLSPPPVARFEDNNGQPCVGCLLYTYSAGTTTKLSTYTDTTDGTPNTNPIILNSRGEANVWLPYGVAYKFVLSPSTDTDPPTNPIWTVDQIVAGAPYDPGNVAITGGTISGVTISSSTINTSTLNSPIINTPTITGGTISGATITGANACFNNSLVKTANYSPVQADIGSWIELSGNSTFTLNFSNAYTTGFVVCIANLDANNAKHIQLPSGTTWLWPNQLMTVWRDNTGTLRRSQAERYMAPSVTVYANSSAGSDSNDCLTTGNACATIQHAVVLIRTYIDTVDTVPTVQLADGTYNEAIDTSASPTGGSDQILITGDAGTPANTKIVAPAASTAVTVRDYGIFTLQNLEVACGTGVGAVNSSQFAVADLLNVIVGACDGQNALTSQDGGHININGLTISGSANALFFVHGVGSQIAAGGGQTITCTGGWAISFFLDMDNVSGFSTEGVPLVFSGCGGVTGQKYNVVNNAVADTQGSVLPGNVAGATATGGIYN